MTNRRTLIANFLRSLARRIDPPPPESLDDEHTRYRRIYAVPANGEVCIAAPRYAQKFDGKVTNYRTLGWIVYDERGRPIRLDVAV